MAKHNVKVTRGSFKLVGNIFGVNDERFMRSYDFESGATKKLLTVGVQTSKINQSFVQLEGWKQKVAKFNKYDRDTKTSLKEECPWDDRFDAECLDDGYSPFFGTRLNLNGEGVVTLFQYDACDELKNGLYDDMPVYVEGQTSFSSYKKNGEVQRYKNLEITKIYKQDSDIDFESDKFKEMNMFKQEIVFMDIEKELDVDTGKPTSRGIVHAKIVTGEGVEDTVFIVEDAKLAKKMQQNLKPYNALTVVGRLVTSVVDKEDSSDDSDWGDDDDFDGGSTIKNREWVITKVKAETIDKETYSESVLASITQADEDFGDDFDEDDDEDVWE